MEQEKHQQTGLQVSVAVPEKHFANRKERLKMAKLDHKERIRLAELKNERFDRTCSLVEVLTVILAIIIVALTLRNANQESIKSTLAIVASVVTVAGGILVWIRKYRRKNKSSVHKPSLPSL
jgi:undecaprenyl pyrophosphate phosphatase UppP